MTDSKQSKKSNSPTITDFSIDNSTLSNSTTNSDSTNISHTTSNTAQSHTHSYLTHFDTRNDAENSEHFEGENDTTDGGANVSQTWVSENKTSRKKTTKKSKKKKSKKPRKKVYKKKATPKPRKRLVSTRRPWDRKVDGKRPRIYIPQDLPLKRILRDNGIRADHYYDYAWVLSSIYLGRHFDKTLTKDDFVCLYTVHLRKVLTPQLVSEVLTNLMGWGLIETDNKFILGKKSRGYRFKKDSVCYTSRYKRVAVTSDRYGRKINKFFEDQKIAAIKAGSEYEYLHDNVKELKIDAKAAREFIAQNYEQGTDSYEARHVSVDMIKSGQIFFTVDNKGRRVHTNMTNLASELRQFIKVKNKRRIKLGQVDIRNSQPFFFNLILKEKLDLTNYYQKKEFDLYHKLTSEGTFYEYLMDNFGLESNDELGRKAFKKKFFASVFFDRNRKEFSKQEELFQKLFPNIFWVIKKLKKGDHANLAISLQYAESSFIIKQCINTIKTERPKAFVATIHDSIVGSVKDLEYFKQVVEREFAKQGLKPTVKIEHFKK